MYIKQLGLFILFLFSSGDGSKRLAGLLHDSALAHGDGFAVSFSISRDQETGRHEPVVVSRLQLHTDSLLKGYTSFDDDEFSGEEEESEEAHTATLFISNLPSPLTNPDVEV